MISAVWLTSAIFLILTTCSSKHPSKAYSMCKMIDRQRVFDRLVPLTHRNTWHRFCSYLSNSGKILCGKKNGKKLQAAFILSSSGFQQASRKRFCGRMCCQIQYFSISFFYRRKTLFVSSSYFTFILWIYCFDFIACSNSCDCRATLHKWYELSSKVYSEPKKLCSTT